MSRADRASDDEPAAPLSQINQFLRAATLVRERIEDLDAYPFSIPAIRHLDRLEFHPQVTFFVGENGAGKSTLIEALAIQLGLNAEGGSRNHRFAERPTESSLHKHLRLTRGMRRPSDLFFLRAESYFNVSTRFDEVHEFGSGEANDALLERWETTSPHEQSHGEAFLTLVAARFRTDGLYLLDEPEAALSPQRQLALLTLLDDFTRRRGCQFVISTHSPLLLAFPRAIIYELTADGIRVVRYEDTEQFRVTRDFLADPQRFLRALLADDDG